MPIAFFERGGAATMRGESSRRMPPRCIRTARSGGRRCAAAMHGVGAPSTHPRPPRSPWRGCGDAGI